MLPALTRTRREYRPDLINSHPTIQVGQLLVQVFDVVLTHQGLDWWFPMPCKIYFVLCGIGVNFEDKKSLLFHLFTPPYKEGNFQFKTIPFKVRSELKALECWILRLMLDPLFFLISRLNLILFLYPEKCIKFNQSMSCICSW